MKFFHVRQNLSLLFSREKNMTSFRAFLVTQNKAALKVYSSEEKKLSVSIGLSQPASSIPQSPRESHITTANRLPSGAKTAIRLHGSC